MYDVLILYEHKNREMESILLLKYELIKRGYKVKISSVYKFKQLKEYNIKAKVVANFCLYGEKEILRYIYGFYGKHNNLINLQWEQVYANELTYEKRIPSGIAKNAVHICWGEYQYNMLKDNGCKNAMLTGPVHMDFLKPAFQNWYLSREELFREYGIDSSKKTLIFISSFTSFYKTEDQMKEIQRFFSYDVLKFRELSINSRNTILEWFVKLAKDNCDINIIYRPHPGELEDEQLKKICDENKNIYCISDYSVKQWISTCDVLLNWLSTAGVEAFFAGKSELILRPYELDTSMDYDMFSNSYSVQDYESFAELIKDDKKIKDYYDKNPRIEKITPHYLNDDSYSFIKVCDVIEKMIKSEGYKIPYIKYSDILRLKTFLKEDIMLKLYNGKEKGNWFCNRILKIKPFIEQWYLHQNSLLNAEYISKDEEDKIFRKLDEIMNDNMLFGNPK